MATNSGLLVQYMVDGGYNQQLQASDRVLQLLHYAARQEGVGGQLSVWICDDASIAKLHHDFMGIEGPTDVMSFPGGDDEARPIPFMRRNETFLGDIAVSFET